MNEVKTFSNWMLSRGKNIEQDVEEFLEEQKSKTISIEVLREKLCEIHKVTVLELLTDKKGKKQKNSLSRARGQLVKYALLNTNLYAASVVYYRLFNFHKDHSTAFYHRNMEYFGEEKKQYQELCKFIETHNVIWP